LAPFGTAETILCFTMFPEIPNYTIVDEIGSGGMATVYRAIDIRLQRTVAIKVLHRHRCRETAAADRFMREARSAAKIDHPNVVRIYEHGTIGDLHYIVMEYVPGSTVERILSEHGTLPADTAMQIMRQIAEALAQAHTLGIIHRDVKPANILLHQQGRAMLSDFGLAHHLPDPRLTTDDAVAGTPVFMSPEQISGRPIGPATDVYSWAICFCTLITGKLPYRSQEFSEVIGEIRRGAVVFDDARLDGLSGPVPDILRQCCIPDPEKRIPNANELVNLLGSPEKQPKPTFDPLFFSGTISAATNNGPSVGPTSTAILPKSGPRTRPVALIVATLMLALLATGFILTKELRRIRPPASGIATSAPQSSPEPMDETSVLPQAPLLRTDTATLHPISAAADQSGLPRSAVASTIPSTVTRRPAPQESPTIAESAIADSGSLFISCTPWATVSVNGREIGTTPFEKPVRLPAGICNITLSNGFCEPLHDTITLNSGAVERRKYALRRLSP
jgi:serine/threonine protein kinase